jgi:hypothetical protein
MAGAPPLASPKGVGNENLSHVLPRHMKETSEGIIMDPRADVSQQLDTLFDYNIHAKND